MNILVTGAAGFIGYHLSIKLLKLNYNVYAIDNINTYYDVDLKKNRLKQLIKYKNFFFYKYDLKSISKIDKLILKNKIKVIIHLAAQAGVRYSIKFPESFVQSNLVGFFNILEVAKKNKINHLIFASTSSVYGNNDEFPSNENLKTDKPLSFYAATKISNELMAYSYSNIHKLPCTALRFFTVYGPYGRPDMSLFKFTKSILSNKKINLFNKGKHDRDFTYIEDIVAGIFLLIKKPSKNKIPYNCFNLGNGNSKKLTFFLKVIESNLLKKAKINYLSLQKGDVRKSHADIGKIKKFVNYLPRTDVNKGIKKFVDWYKKYHKVI